MRKLFDALNKLIQEFNSIGNFIKLNASDGLSAVKAITNYSAKSGIETIIPKMRLQHAKGCACSSDGW